MNSLAEIGVCIKKLRSHDEVAKTLQESSIIRTSESRVDCLL
jgi:hypothetical protein